MFEQRHMMAVCNGKESLNAYAHSDNCPPHDQHEKASHSTHIQAVKTVLSLPARGPSCEVMIGTTDIEDDITRKKIEL